MILGGISNNIDYYYVTLGVRLWKFTSHFFSFGSQKWFEFLVLSSVGDSMYGTGPIDMDMISARWMYKCVKNETGYQVDWSAGKFNASQYFEIDYDKENGVLEITPLFYKNEFSETEAGQICGDNIVIAISFTLIMSQLELTGMSPFYSVLGDKDDFLFVGDGGFGDSQSFSTMAVGWKDHDELIEFVGQGPDGQEYNKTLRLITHSLPCPIESYTSDVAFDTQNIQTNDEELANNVAVSIQSSGSFGVESEALQNAALDTVDLADIVGQFNQDSQFDIYNVIVWSYLDVSLMNVERDEDDISFKLSISPKYDVLVNDENGSGIVLDSGTIHFNDPVEMKVYIGELLSAGTNVSVIHTKDDGITQYTYVGTVGEDGYLRYVNEHGFSTFEIATGESGQSSGTDERFMGIFNHWISYVFYHYDTNDEQYVAHDISETGRFGMYADNCFDISIPENVTSLGICAFSGCSSLAEIVIPEGITSLNETFEDCYSLTKISIPVSITDIYGDTFTDCRNLTTVYYAGTEEQWSEIRIQSTNNEYLLNATIVYAS